MKKNLTIWLSLLLLLGTELANPHAVWAGACTAARFNDWNSFGCHRVPGGNQEVCTNCGMPRWSVEEPYINLYISDTPLSYKTSSGQDVAFTFNYKMRYMLPMMDQCPDAYYVGGSLPVRQGMGPNDPYMANMRTYGLTNAAWLHNWMSEIVFWDSGWEAADKSSAYGISASTLFVTNYEGLIISPSGGIDYFSQGSSSVEPNTQATLSPVAGSYPTVSAPTPDTNQIYWGSTSNGLKRTYADGSQEIFSLCFYSGGGPPGGGPLFAESTVDAFLTQRIDPQGRVTQVGYEQINFTNYWDPRPIPRFVYRIKYVVDSDGRTNTFRYNTNNASGIWPPRTAWELQEIDDPYGRKTTFGYADFTTGYLTNITDAAGNSNSFSYTTFQGTNTWINKLFTPYGTTHFAFDQQSDPATTNQNSFKERALYVNEPTGAQQLYCYIHQATSGAPPSTTSPTNITGHTNFDDGTHGDADYGLSYRDTFHWGRLQTANLSSRAQSAMSAVNLGAPLANLIGDLNSNDFQKAHLSHWLLTPNTGTEIIDDGLSVTELISDERDPSPDAAGNTTGAWTFYDYSGKSSPELAGDPEVTCTARLLPDGSSQYTRFSYYTGYPPPLPGLVADSETSITLPNGSPGELTNYFNYAANGIDLTNISNSVGQTVKFAYNSSHEITFITNSLNQLATLTWDSGTFNLTSITQFNGQSFNFSYYPTNTATNTTALLEQMVVQPENLTVTIADYTNGLPRIVHGSGTGMPDLWVTNAWDGLNRLTGRAFQDNSTVSNVYTVLDLAARKDRMGHWTYFDYDGLQHLTSITDAKSNVTTFAWCGCGSLTFVTNALTNVTALDYDNQGQLTNLAFPDSSSLSYQYDSVGRMTNVFDGLSRSLALAYNIQGLATNASSANGVVWQCVYDAVNRPVSVTDANGVTVTNRYDPINQLLSRTWLADGVSENFVYATNGLIAYTNRDSKVTYYGRDAAGRLTSVTNANNQVTQFGYNALDEITGLTDGLNHTTTWNYNQFGWVTNKVDALSHVAFVYAYDANGRLTNRWTPVTTSTRYFYDPVGNLTNITYSGSSPATNSYAYDALNRLTNAINAVATNEFTYTRTGQFASESNPFSGLSGAISFSYTQGQRTGLTETQITGNWTQSYGYDSGWRMNSLTSPAGTFGYGYAAGSASALVQTTSLPNAAYIANGYDSLARMTNTALLNRWGHVLDGYGYGYDPLGLRTNVVRNLGLTTNDVAVGYDNIGQLISWTGQESGGAARLNEQLGYGFDAAGNLESRTNGALIQTFNVDALNQLSTVTRSGPLTLTGATPAPASSVTVNSNSAQIYGDFTFARTNLSLTNGANTFTIVAGNSNGLSVTNALSVNLPSTNVFQYDANGNLTNDGTRTFVYDGENQLTSVFAAGEWRTDFLYDGLRRRRITREYSWGSNWVQTNEVRYLYDGMLVIQERDSSNTPQVTYTRGLDLSGSVHGAGGIGGLLARTDGNGSTYYHADGAGNVTALMDGNKNIVGRYEYDPFGKMVDKWGPVADANRYRFSSKEISLASGLYSYGLRFYEPKLQRWLNRDPIHELGGINLYGFAANSALNVLDLFGLSPPVAVAPPAAGPSVVGGAPAMLDTAEGAATAAQIGEAGTAGTTAASLFAGGGVITAETALGLGLPVAGFGFGAGYATSRLIGLDNGLANLLVPDVGSAPLPFPANRPHHHRSQTQAAGPPRKPPCPPKKTVAGFPGDDPDNHHRLPRQFQDRFEQQGLDIEDFTKEMPMQWHRGEGIGIHSQGYNEAWQSFFEENPFAGPEQTLSFLDQLERSLGFGVLPP